MLALLCGNLRGWCASRKSDVTNGVYALGTLDAGVWGRASATFDEHMKGI